MAWCPACCWPCWGPGCIGLDENIRSSLVLGFVGAGGTAFPVADGGDEPVPIPRGRAAADRDLRDRARGREAGGVPRVGLPARQENSRACCRCRNARTVGSAS